MSALDPPDPGTFFDDRDHEIALLRNDLNEARASLAAMTSRAEKAEGVVDDYALNLDEARKEAFDAIAAKDKAEAACAVMRDALEYTARGYPSMRCHEAAVQALASDAGAAILARLKAAEEERGRLRAWVTAVEGFVGAGPSDSALLILSDWKRDVAQLAERDAEIGRLRAALVAMKLWFSHAYGCGAFVGEPCHCTYERRMEHIDKALAPVAEDSARKEG